MQKNLFQKKILLIISIVFIVTGCKQNNNSVNSDTISVIPQPQSVEAFEGLFTIDKNTKIQYQGKLKNVAVALSEQLSTKNTVQEFKAETDNQILLSISKNDTLEKEGYELTINKNGIKIEGDAAGVFYGVQTLMQLLVETEGKMVVPHVHIVDNPRFEWRGMHLDVSRHFFDKEFVKKYIDILAKHKLNVFHWHLTDDQGWRIEIDKYPKLTEIGAWRMGNADDKWSFDIYGTEEGKPKYGGFYTKDDIREVLAYSKERFVTVVPEIELPAHSWSVLHAYPNLSCTGKDWHMGKEWSFTDPFCTGNEETFEFLENVLTEVIDLFPSEYIHIGGDEAQKTRWSACSKCQARIKNEGLENEEELQSYFIKRIEKFVQSKGRKIIGWDEILEGGLAPDAAVMSWRGEKGGIKAAQLKHDVIMTPAEFLYFNYPQSNPEVEIVSYAEIIDLKTVYNYNPVPEVLNQEEQKYIKGVEACLWSEYFYSEEQVINRLSPRVLALSEIAWTETKNKDWEHFRGKLTNHLSYLDKQSIDYFIETPASSGMSTFVGDSLAITLNSPFKDAKVYYTLDSSEPNSSSILYNKVIVIKDNVTLKAKTVLPSGKMSAVFERSYRKTKYQEATELTNATDGLILQSFKGIIGQLSEFNTLKKLNAAETTSVITFPTKIPNGSFGLKFTGYIKIPKDGIYTFYTSSDDGSALYINDKMVVDNDGKHGMQEEKGEVALKAGYHKFTVRYFEAGGGKGLEVKIQGSSMEKGTIPSNILFN